MAFSLVQVDKVCCSHYVAALLFFQPGQPLDGSSRLGWLLEENNNLGDGLM